jgi:hypothetical protein
MLNRSAATNRSSQCVPKKRFQGSAGDNDGMTKGWLLNVLHALADRFEYERLFLDAHQHNPSERKRPFARFDESTLPPRRLSKVNQVRYCAVIILGQRLRLGRCRPEVTILAGTASETGQGPVHDGPLCEPRRRSRVSERIAAAMAGDRPQK